jgi:cytochrome P450
VTATASPASPAARAEAEEIVRRLLTDPPQDPYPLYARLREIDPIHRASVGDFWTLTRYDDVHCALRDKRFVRDYDDFRRRNSNGPVDYERPFVRSQRQWFIFSNPPEYLPKRALYNTAFNRAYVDGLRPMIARFTNELLDRAAEHGQIEIVEDLGYELTVRVISHILGLPEPADSKLFVEWAHAIGPTFDPLVTEDTLRRADEATVKLSAFLREFVDRVRCNPGDDLLSRLIAADEQGVLTEDELMANAALVFSAGLETTTHFIGNCVYSLLRNSDQWELFVSAPERLVKKAVEELLRYESSVQADAPLRLAVKNVEIAGVTIPAGEGVVPFIGAANRDPARYEQPDRLDITRPDVRTMSFGGGLHICLGQHLARVETQVALVTLAERFPGMKLCGADPTWRPGVTNRALNALNVRLG